MNRVQPYTAIAPWIWSWEPAAPFMGSRGVIWSWIAWWGMLLAVTAAMYRIRGDLAQVHVVLVYLLVVLGGSASGGRALGVVLACVASILIDYFFQSPYDRITVASPLDFVVLLAFLATAVVTTDLLARARERTAEVEQLARLGSETLNSGGAEDALAAMAAVIRRSLGVATCVIVPATPDATPPEPADPDAHRLVFPLRVSGRTVGTLRLEDTQPLRLSGTRQRLLEALAYYAALATERVRLGAEAAHAEAAREAVRLKDALLTSVSHDLRTPLATIKALAQSSRESGDDWAVVIEEQADRLSRLVTDLLDLSRLKGNAFPVVAETNAAEDLLGAATRQMAATLASREVIKFVDYSEPVLLGRFDFIQSLRILSNLIENAHRYSPLDAPIELTVQREGKEVLFLVADRGPGIPPADSERIFETFYRGRAASPDAGGAGLGLAIARQLAQAQGGVVTHAPRLGGGTVFTLRLPAVDADEPPDEDG